MRLLYVIDSLAPGGAETSLAEMAPGLVANGIDLHVLPLGHRLDLSGRLVQAGAVVHQRGTRDGRVGNLRAVLDVARRASPDLIHTTLFEADVAGRTAARAMGIPSSSSFVNDAYGPSHYAESSTPRLHAARALDAATAQFARQFHAITSSVAATVPPRLGVSRKKVVVIPRGRDPERLPMRSSITRAETRIALQVPARAPVVLAVGRLEPQKGLDQLLRAVPIVLRDHPDLVLLIAGKDGRSGTSLRSMAQALDCDIRFLGHRDDVPGLLAAADVLCFPSEREGLGGVLIESLAVGCPIVATSIPTTVEVLGSDTALLAPYGDVQRLAEMMIRVLSEPGEADLRARRGRLHFEERFQLKAVTDLMALFFHETSKDSPHRGSGAP